ncbi:MAG TPA: SpoIIE family protein phosphatase [Bacteroidia bacterium]|jgi:serine phosphatase RsbU (regulator of sigma subunit)
MSGLDPKQLYEEKEKLEKLRLELEEKNRQMFAMSETVYREKKKVEEQLNKMLEEKTQLVEQKKQNEEQVKMLWQQSTAIHQEKQRIDKLRTEIEYRHKEVMDSVHYAKKIQEAILPERKEILESFPESFILFKPRDIVSGDFYWFSQKAGQTIIAAVDCTGHGVPGAFMSMIGNTLLNQIVNEKGMLVPSEILHHLDEEITVALKQTQEDSESRDGMDIAICCFDKHKKEMQYAGAMRPLYLIRNDELIETKASKFAMGGHDLQRTKAFTTHTITLQKNDTIYISTDGFADQFNSTDKKLMTKRFKEILLSIQEKSMEEQHQYLDRFIEDWKGGMEQTDDILVIGIRV